LISEARRLNFRRSGRDRNLLVARYENPGRGGFSRSASYPFGTGVTQDRLPQFGHLTYLAPPILCGATAAAAVASVNVDPQRSHR